MTNIVKAYCVADLVFNWKAENREAETELVLVNAIMHGALKVTDPVTDKAILDTEKDKKEFLEKNPNYRVHCFMGGHETIFRSDYFEALWEKIEYGNASSDAFFTYSNALASLCVKKQDFLEWLKKIDKSLPSFWFSGDEISKNPTSKIRAMVANTISRMNDPAYMEALSEKLDAINAIRNIPVLLHSWFKYDTWRKEEGLMLLAGLSPNTLFGTEESMYGEALRKVRYFETLDGLDHDPAGGWSYEKTLSQYENLWNSGEHPVRATPKYFIDWALSKNLQPSWLQWASENHYYKSEVSDLTTDKEVSGKSETAYLHIIGALCDLYWREKYPENSKINQTEIISMLEAYGGFPGLSERNLKDKLSRGIKAIRNE